jgi:hypothetical protein
MSSRIAILRSLILLVPAALCSAGTIFTPPPGPIATPAQIAAVLATVPPPAPGETVVDFEGTEIGTPMIKWEEKGMSFALAGPLQNRPAAKPRIEFFPHEATGHKGVVNAMSTDQGVPLKMTFPGAGASSVTLVLWGSTKVPVLVEACDKDGKVLDKKALEAIPSRKAPNEPTPFLTLKLQGDAIAYVLVSGPRSGEYLATDEVRFVPVTVK